MWKEVNPIKNKFSFVTIHIDTKLNLELIKNKILEMLNDDANIYSGQISSYGTDGFTYDDYYESRPIYLNFVNNKKYWKALIELMKCPQSIFNEFFGFWSGTKIGDAIF